jgi:phosphopantetheinyl transferase
MMATVHTIRLDRIGSLIPRNVLDKREGTRCKHYLQAQDRLLFIGSRALAKVAVSLAIGRDPGLIQLGSTPSGRPFVHGFSEQQISFSHSGDLVAFAISSTMALGVDVEVVDQDLDYAPLVRRFFMVNEASALEMAPNEAQRRREFFRLWTGKEALAKGLGLSMDAALATDLSELVNKKDTVRVRGWSVLPLSMPDDAMMTLAGAGRGIQVSRRHWQENELIAYW